MKFTLSLTLFIFAAIARANEPGQDFTNEALPSRPGDMAGNIDVPAAEAGTADVVVGF
ncbi:hypothetical protein C8R47DRAFT_1226402 [Mycena vitilis]|nr:hypothetical protein C8R47DRAFT_1226402 [Mycena vitilis]